MNTQYVGALNLVEVEFNKFPNVLAKWKELYEHLHTPSSEGAELEVMRAWNAKMDRLHTLLIHAIARSSKLPIEQLDIIAGYAPRAWEEDEQLQKQIQKALLSILSGQEPLVIKQNPDIQIHNPYPPAP